MSIQEKQYTKKPFLKEADLLQLVGKVLSKWKFILKVTTCAMVLGLIMALTMIKEYTAQVVVAPESSSSSMIGGGLASLASLAGVDMGTGGDAIYPLLYPDIIRSLPFLCSLMDVHVQSSDGSVDTTYCYYVKKLHKKPWVGKVMNFLPKMIGKFLSLFKEKVPEGNFYVFDPYRLSEKQMEIVKTLDTSIEVAVDLKTEVITLSFTDQDPQIAAMMVDTIKVRLQERITEYRTKKAVADCEYIEKLYKESKVEYEKAQEAYAEYVDRNRNVTQERFLIEKERLEADRDLKNSLYMQWAQQLQLSKARVQEYTPAFTTLKPASVPALPSSMSRSMMVILYTFLGGVLAVAYVLLKEHVVAVFRELFGKK